MFASHHPCAQKVFTSFLVRHIINNVPFSINWKVPDIFINLSMESLVYNRDQIIHSWFKNIFLDIFIYLTYEICMACWKTWGSASGSAVCTCDVSVHAFLCWVSLSTLMKLHSVKHVIVYALFCPHLSKYMISIFWIAFFHDCASGRVSASLWAGSF